MSYIRSISNPEGLYIFGSEEGVEIMRGSEMIGVIPTEVFTGLIKEYIDGFCENCEYKGASIKEKWILGHPKTVLSYNNFNIIMWEVTWYYIASNNYKKMAL